MAKKSQSLLPIEEREIQRWEVGQHGFGNTTAPAVRIVIVERVNLETREAIDYFARAEFAKVTGGAWIDHMPGGAELKFHTKQENAFRLAKRTLIGIVYKEYCNALDKSDFANTLAYYNLRSTIKDEAALEMARLKGKARVTFKMLQDVDEALALRVARRFFTDTDEALNIAFRFRASDDGEPWISGRDLKGKPRKVKVRAEKMSAEKQEIYRQLWGWAPTIMVTICWSVWSAMSERQRQALLHGALQRVWFDDDTGAVAITEPEVATSVETVREFADVLTKPEREMIGAALRGAVNQGKQLSIFGLLDEEIDEIEGLWLKAELSAVVVKEGAQDGETGAETPEEPSAPKKPRQRSKAAPQAGNLPRA